MDVNSLLSNELGVVALPYSIVSSNDVATPQDAATLVSMPTVLSSEDAQWIPGTNGPVLLTFSAINSIPLEKGQEADSSTTFLPFVPSLFLTENGTLVSSQMDGSPQPVTILEPSMIDSPQAIIDIEPSPLAGDHVLTSVLESGSDNSPLPTVIDDLANSEFATSVKEEQLFDDSFHDIVTVVTLYKCKLCEFKCEDEHELAQHLIVHKSESTRTKSKRRSKPTQVNEKPGLQKKRKAGGAPRVAEGEDCNTHMFFSCGACLTVCTSMDELREHMKEIHGIKKEEEEDECGEDAPVMEVSTSSPAVIESVAEVDNEDVELRVVTVTTPLVDGLRELKFQCTMCKLRFSTRVNMERHRKCHNPDYNGPGVPKFKCLVCEQIYNRWAFCQAHLWLVHKIDMDLHTCLICDYKTVHRFQYLIHQKRHQQLKEFACRYCAKQFSQKTQLRNHEVLHMKKNADANLPDWAKPKECDLCHKTFCDSKALKKHVKTVHSKLKPYVCQVCGHCSARKGMFQLHIRQHTGDKPFSCSACDFTTRDHNCLRRHTMRHTGVRQYQCKFCSYSAIQAQLFKQHLIKNHGGDGVFLCNICSFSTLNEQAFIYHHHDDDQKPEIDKLEDKPTVIYVPFNEKDKSSKKGSGELIAINLPDDEESNNFFDHEAAIDTGGITIVEDVEEDKNYSSDPPQSVTTSLNTRGEESAMEGMEVSTQGESAILESKEVSDNDGPLRDNVKDVPTTKWGIPENVDDSTLF